MKLIIDIPIEEITPKAFFDYFKVMSTELSKTLMNGIPYDEKPQGDLISREALKKAINEIWWVNKYDLDKIVELIDNAPTVKAFTEEDMAGAYNEGYMCGNKEAEKGRPQGEWIFRSGGYYKCNKCGEVERAEKNYCSNCGAKMGGK